MHGVHSRSCFHLVGTFFNHTGQRLSQENEKQRDTEHDTHDNTTRKRIACHKENDGCYNGNVENKSGNTVWIKPGTFNIFASCGIDNMQDHRHDNQEHTKCNCNDKYSVQFTKEWQCSHMIDRSYPQWFNDVFKSENTSEHKSEDCGKYTGSCDNSGKWSFLKVIDQGSAD